MSIMYSSFPEVFVQEMVKKHFFKVNALTIDGYHHLQDGKEVP